MAVQTAASVKRHNLGAINMVLASFTSVGDADTWASGIKGILAVVPVDKTGTTTAGVAASYSGSTVTFKTATNGKAVDLIVFTRS